MRPVPRAAPAPARPLDWTAEERLALRQRESVPILDRIEKYLDELSGRVLPKSALGKAVRYARNQWAALRRYVSDGRLTIDNNVSERTACSPFLGPVIKQITDAVLQ